jgi:hypothetical protein
VSPLANQNRGNRTERPWEGFRPHGRSSCDLAEQPPTNRPQPIPLTNRLRDAVGILRDQ